MVQRCASRCFLARRSRCRLELCQTSGSRWASLVGDQFGIVSWAGPASPRAPTGCVDAIALSLFPDSATMSVYGDVPADQVMINKGIGYFLRTRGRRVGLVLCVLVVVAIVGYPAYWRFPILGACHDVVRTESKSPEGQFVASVFERDCGATTGYSTIVSLREAKTSFNAEQDLHAVVLSGKCDVAIHWQDSVVNVSYSKPCEIFREVPAWRHVRIATGHQ